MEQLLADAAERYRAQGYRVVVHPKPIDLPDFAKSFDVEIVARRADCSALVSAKETLRDLESDSKVASYAEITATQPGWRFDVVVLKHSDEPMPIDDQTAKEPSEEQLAEQFRVVQWLLDANCHQQALVLAWSVLEAVMRRRLHAEGENAGWGTSPRSMMNELLSVGAISTSAFRDMERSFQVRSAVVHGFIPQPIEPAAVKALLDVARQLLDEANLVDQPA